VTLLFRLTCLLQLKKFKEDFDLFDQDQSDDINVKEMQVREVNAVGICIAPMQSSSVSSLPMYDYPLGHLQEAWREGSF
jgi:hypothetical protein